MTGMDLNGIDNNFKYSDEIELDNKFDLMKKIKRLPEVGEFYRFINSNGLRDEALSMLSTYLENVE